MMLFKGKFKNAVGNLKIDKEINDLMIKKQTLIKSVQNDTKALSEKLYRIYAEIGQAAYEAYLSESFSVESFNSSFKEIDDIKKTIAEKDAKIKEISNRYDEEITLLNNLQQSAPEAETAPVAETAALYCGKCKQSHLADDFFCKKCGNKLK